MQLNKKHFNVNWNQIYQVKKIKIEKNILYNTFIIKFKYAWK